MWGVGIRRKKNDKREPTWHWVTNDGRAECDSAIMVSEVTCAAPPRGAYTCGRCVRERGRLHGAAEAANVMRRRIAELEAMLRAAGYSDEQIKAGTPYIELMGG
jgi:hypothetical protein